MKPIKKQKTQSDFSLMIKELFIKRWYFGLVGIALAALIWIAAAVTM